MQMAYFEKKIFFVLSIPCERAHCQLHNNIGIIEIGPSKPKFWLIELEMFRTCARQCMDMWCHI